MSENILPTGEELELLVRDKFVDAMDTIATDMMPSFGTRPVKFELPEPPDIEERTGQITSYKLLAEAVPPGTARPGQASTHPSGHRARRPPYQKIYTASEIITRPVTADEVALLGSLAVKGHDRRPKQVQHKELQLLRRLADEERLVSVVEWMYRGQSHIREPLDVRWRSGFKNVQTLDDPHIFRRFDALNVEPYVERESLPAWTSTEKAGIDADNLKSIDIATITYAANVRRLLDAAGFAGSAAFHFDDLAPHAARLY